MNEWSKITILSSFEESEELGGKGDIAFGIVRKMVSVKVPKWQRETLDRAVMRSTEKQA